MNAVKAPQKKDSKENCDGLVRNEVEIHTSSTNNLESQRKNNSQIFAIAKQKNTLGYRELNRRTFQKVCENRNDSNEKSADWNRLSFYSHKEDGSKRSNSVSLSPPPCLENSPNQSSFKARMSSS